MGTTGLIYAAIAFAWLAYLIPNYLRNKDDATAAEADPNDRFSDSVRILRSGAAPLLNQDLAVMPSVEVSTPLTRRAAIRELRRLEESAAARRRRVLIVLMVLLTAAIAVWAVHLAPAWCIAVPAGLVLTFFLVSRFGVAAMRRDLDARYRRIREGSDEATVLLNRTEMAAALNGRAAGERDKKPTVRSATGGLWEPLPITMPTYVSKPLAPRTVRTIDLSSPELSLPIRTDGPVTADRPVPLPLPRPDQVVEVARPAAGPEQTAPADTGVDGLRAVGE